MIGMARHLGEDLVFLEQRNDDQLTEQAGAHGLQNVPRGLELERARRAELDAHHQALAARRLHELMAARHVVERPQQTRAESRRIRDQALRLDHLERGQPGRHGEIVLGEGRAVHDGTIHAVEHLVEDALAG